MSGSSESVGADKPVGIEIRDGIRLAEGERLALVYNPKLRLLRLQVGMAEARVTYAGLWDDPEFQIDALYITESVEDPWIVSSSLALPIPMAGTREAERQSAKAELDVQQERIEEAEWDVLHQVRRGWITWSATKQRLDAAQQILAQLDGLVDSSRDLVEAGELVRTEAALFSMERIQRRVQVQQLFTAFRDEEQGIRAMLGLRPDTKFELLPLPEIEIPTLQPLAAEALPERNPSIRRRIRELKAAERRLQWEIRKQRPDFTVGPMFESDQGEARVGALAAVPLPILSGNRKAIAEAMAERNYAEAAVEAEIERQTAAMARSASRLNTLREQNAEIEQRLTPLVERQVTDAMRLLRLGEGSGLVLLESLVRAHQMTMQRIDTLRDLALAHVELTFVAGPPSPRPSNQDDLKETP